MINSNKDKEYNFRNNCIVIVGVHYRVVLPIGTTNCFNLVKRVVFQELYGGKAKFFTLKLNLNSKHRHYSF